MLFGALLPGLLFNSSKWLVVGLPSYQAMSMIYKENSK